MKMVIMEMRMEATGIIRTVRIVRIENKAVM